VLTQREYLEIDLEIAERQLADVTAPSRQTEPTEAGRAYRKRLQQEIQELRERLASEEG
jgi:hypothetical protein